MDFGDILDEWERQTAKPAGKKAIKAQERALNQQAHNGVLPPDEKVNPLTAWLRVHGVEDKDNKSSDRELSDMELRRQERKRLSQKAPDAVVDLHGLTRDEAWDQLILFFNKAKNHGAEKVLIIHGKGNHSEGEAVLKRTTLQFIEQCPYAGMHGHPPAEGGGSGATWVCLKKDITARDR
ncbi:Smr/MutS family protein [Gracilinema caldarium]|uniref:Smr protein/MutS2 n=1 Tax=Gracilinema caldarium (strain ATCC 51460 / DSM 7334 / H1) TaxID=744872 RepID=F8F3W6_GRAC1|nr:Smr/MutS family protein [Gracilinema caldarium]AEJ20485.1 Smr protein/MutS2 [Gracilinema caldarium DSM 7334]